MLIATVSTTDIARSLGLSRVTVWRWCTEHPGLAIRIGGRFRPDPRKFALIAKGIPLADAAVADVDDGEAA